jgi:hypothetical protein
LILSMSSCGVHGGCALTTPQPQEQQRLQRCLSNCEAPPPAFHRHQQALAPSRRSNCGSEGRRPCASCLALPTAWPRLITNQLHVALAKPTTAPCGILRCRTALFFLVGRPLHDALNSTSD